jgi:hypothetical protein
MSGKRAKSIWKQALQLVYVEAFENERKQVYRRIKREYSRHKAK